MRLQQAGRAVDGFWCDWKVVPGFADTSDVEWKITLGSSSVETGKAVMWQLWGKSEFTLDIKFKGLVRYPW